MFGGQICLYVWHRSTSDTSSESLNMVPDCPEGHKREGQAEISTYWLPDDDLIWLGLSQLRCIPLLQLLWKSMLCVQLQKIMYLSAHCWLSLEQMPHDLKSSHKMQSGHATAICVGVRHMHLSHHSDVTGIAAYGHYLLRGRLEPASEPWQPLPQGPACLQSHPSCALISSAQSTVFRITCPPPTKSLQAESSQHGMA